MPQHFSDSSSTSNVPHSVKQIKLVSHVISHPNIAVMCKIQVRGERGREGEEK